MCVCMCVIWKSNNIIKWKRPEWLICWVIWLVVFLFFLKLSLFTFLIFHLFFLSLFLSSSFSFSSSPSSPFFPFPPFFLFLFTFLLVFFSLFHCLFSFCYISLSLSLSLSLRLGFFLFSFSFYLSFFTFSLYCIHNQKKNRETLRGNRVIWSHETLNSEVTFKTWMLSCWNLKASFKFVDVIRPSILFTCILFSGWLPF